MTRIPYIKQAILDSLGVGYADLIYDENANEVKLPVSIADTECEIVFRIEEHIYEIVFPYGVEFNFVDGEHYDDKEVIGDIKDIVAAILDSRVKVITKRLLWMSAHEYVGLDEGRFASTGSVGVAIAQKLGSVESVQVLCFRRGGSRV